MAKQGRPRAETLNPIVVTDALSRLDKPKSWLCSEVGISAGHLSDALSDRCKGIAPEKVDEMARVLGCSPAVLAPGRLDRFVAVRIGDPAPEAAA